MAGITDYLTSKIKGLLTPERWDGFIRALDVRFGVLEEQLGIERRVTESILQRGLQVIEDGIGPAIIQAEQAANNISAIANLGMVFTAPSATTVLIGMGQKSFTIPTNRKDQFAPAAIMMAYAGSDYSNAIIGSTASYNRSTGVLVLDVIETIGSGIFNAWTLTPVATTADLEALRDQVQADRLQSGLNAGAAVNAKNDAQSIATDFRAKYLGTRATDPTTDGNGNPVSIGALYTNAGSGKLRYYGLSGWQDTTAGSNIVRYTFVTDDRGTAPYPLPEAPASKDNCFVIVGNDPLKGSAFNVDGTNFSFVTNPGVGVTVEVKIIAQLAIGIPSDETVDAAKIKGAAADAIRTKIGLDDLLAAKAGNDVAVRVDGAQVFSENEKGRARANTGVGTVAGFRNKVINGGFEIAQRALSQTSSGYGSDDRWDNSHVGTTKTHSVQAFTLGQTDVAGEPAWFSRTVVTSVAGVNNFCNKIQRIEGVRTLAGKRATLTFYAKANAAKTVAVQIFQWFGTGGAPSPQVSAKIEKVALTTAWKRFDIVADIPSLAGKTLGSSNTDHLGVIFWFDAGSSFDVHTASLGQQSGTFDISRVSLVEGDATAESDPFSPRHYDEELRLCERYYQKISINGLCGITYIPNGDTRAFVKLSRKMRVSPGLSVTPSNLVVVASGDAGAAVNVDLGNMTLNTAGPDAIRIGNVANPGQLGTASANVASWGTATPHVFSADAEL